MRKHLIAFIALPLAGLVLSAQAQPRDLPACRSSYEPAWAKVSRGDDLAAMDRVIASIPADNCPNLRGEALSQRANTASRIASARAADEQRRLADLRAADDRRIADETAASDQRRAVEAAEARARSQAREREAALARERETEIARVRETVEREADDKAWSVAKQGDSPAAYAGYLSAYPYGRHASDARSARDRLNQIKLSVCNNSTADKIYAGMVYGQVGNKSSWRGDGWFEVERGNCRELFTTDNRDFYVHMSEDDGRIWENASSETYSFCAHKKNAFGFDWTGGSCPAGTEVASYRKYTVPAGMTAFSAKVVDSNVPLVVTVCNKSGRKTGVATSYVNPDAKSVWRHVGWFILEDGACSEVLRTRNPYFYLRAEAQDGSGLFWGGTGEDVMNLCLQYPGPYDFQLAKSAACPSGAESKQFAQMNVAISQGTFTWTLDP